MILTELKDRGLVRLISATYHKPPVLSGLVDNDEEMALLTDLEGQTSARLEAEKGNDPSWDPLMLAWRKRQQDISAYGNSHINAAFTYTRAGGNRFNVEQRGAWYSAWDTQVSIAEVAFHRTRELSYIGKYEDKARYVEIISDCIGEFADIRDEPDHPCLHADPAVGYPKGQALSEALIADEHIGLIYPSVRAPEGDCLVVFDPTTVRNVRPGASWDLVWDGSLHYSAKCV
jgi:RES domain-containing protein